jgi:hypothetical protein
MEICEDFDCILDFESAVHSSVKNKVMKRFLKNILISDINFFLRLSNQQKILFFLQINFIAKIIFNTY